MDVWKFKLVAFMRYPMTLIHGKPHIVDPYPFQRFLRRNYKLKVGSGGRGRRGGRGAAVKDDDDDDDDDDWAASGSDGSDEDDDIKDKWVKD